MMNILGISAFYHDSAAALIADGRIVAAAQEERFTRKKNDASFPHKAITYCLEEGKLTLEDIDHIVFYDKPFLKFERLLETYLAFAPRGFKSFSKSMPVWLREKLFQKDLIYKKLKAEFGDANIVEKLLFSEHHLSHAASAFFPSPFEEALVLTMDGVGEWATTSVAIGKGNEIKIHKEIHFPHSIGLLYSAFTYYLGFRVNSGEYKVMGLAPYGQPVYAQQIFDHLVDVKDDGSFCLDQSYFDYCTGQTMTNDAFAKLFGGPVRTPREPLTQKHMDLAASIQAVTEEIMLRLTRSLAHETGQTNLCLAGGVALNCVANGKILRDGAFQNVWIQPASGDAGGALGAALVAHHIFKGQTREVIEEKDRMQGGYLGPQYSQEDIELRLKSAGARFETLAYEDMISQTADALAASKAVGWFQGRMEFGPRALGGRSILGDPRSSNMQKELNLKIKFRESFRPFAPSILRENLSDWFDLNSESPYMLIVADVAERHRCDIQDSDKTLTGIDKLNVKRSTIPAVTHVDYSARIQTVSSDTNPQYYDLIKAFKQRTGCPVVVNTSFNVRGEPIVEKPEDAFNCFMGNELDILVIGNCIMRKEDQDTSLKTDYKNIFDLD